MFSLFFFAFFFAVFSCCFFFFFFFFCCFFCCFFFAVFFLGCGSRHGEGGETTCASGRDSVESDCLKTRGGMSKTYPYPSLVGGRGGGTTRADHRESNGN